MLNLASAYIINIHIYIYIYIHTHTPSSQVTAKSILRLQYHVKTYKISNCSFG